MAPEDEDAHNELHAESIRHFGRRGFQTSAWGTWSHPAGALLSLGVGLTSSCFSTSSETGGRGVREGTFTRSHVNEQESERPETPAYSAARASSWRRAPGIVLWHLPYTITLDNTHTRFVRAEGAWPMARAVVNSNSPVQCGQTRREDVVWRTGGSRLIFDKLQKLTPIAQCVHLQHITTRPMRPCSAHFRDTCILTYKLEQFNPRSYEQIVEDIRLAA